MRYVIIVLALALLVYLVIDFNNRTADLSHLRTEQGVVNGELQVRQATKDALEAQIAYATSDRAVEEWAYENHLVRPGDVAIIPVQPAGATPTPQPRPAVTVTSESNLERWINLFFDPLQ
jgi:hypothetical protein